MPFLERGHLHGRILQQDNDRANNLAYNYEFCGDMDIATLQCSDRSPDVDPIENVQLILAQHVYHNRRLQDTAEDLRESLCLVWGAIYETVTGASIICDASINFYHRMLWGTDTVLTAFKNEVRLL